MKKCKDIMTGNPRCCVPGDTIEKAAQIMREQDIGPVMVCESEENKTLIGILTDRDIAIKVAAEGKDPRVATVEEAMSRDPVCCLEDEDMEGAVKKMEENQVRRIPVVDESNCLVGIIAQADIALRVDKPKKTAEVVREVSKPAAQHHAGT